MRRALRRYRDGVIRLSAALGKGTTDIERLGNLIFRRRSTPSRPAARPIVLATYTSSTWYQRHRLFCLVSLVLFCLFYGFCWTIFGRFFLPALLAPLAILFAITIWLLPEQDKAPESLLATGLFAYITALLCWPDYIAVALPGLPWITVIRLISFPLAFLTLACLSISPDLRDRVKRTIAPSPWIWKGVTVFAVLGLLSLVLSKSPGDSLQRYIIAQINWTLMFFVACIVFVQPGTVRRLAALLWGIVIFVSAIGLWEARISRLPWAGHIPSFLAIQDESVQRILAGTARAGTNVYRVQSKFGTSLGLAEFLAVATPFVLHFIVTGRNQVTRLAAAATIPLIVYIVYKTDSRLAAIGLFGSLALYILFWAVMQWRRHPGRPLGPLVTMAYPAIFALFVASTFFVTRIRAQVWGDGSQQASTDARMTMYTTGIPMVLKNPIGYGFGQGAATLGYRNPGGTLTIDTYYLAVALEFGIVGFVAFYGMFLAAIWMSASTVFHRGEDEEAEWLGPIAIALVNFVVGKSVFSNMENHALLFILLGVVAALIYRERRAAGTLPAARALATTRTKLRLARPARAATGA